MGQITFKIFLDPLFQEKGLSEFGHIKYMETLCLNCSKCNFFKKGNCQNPKDIGFVCHDERLCFENGNIPQINNLLKGELIL